MPRPAALSKAAEVPSERFIRQVEEAPWFFAGGIALIFLFVNGLEAYHRPFWLDENIALYISGLPHISDVWQALLNAMDGNPPLYYLASRPVLAILGVSEFSFRLLSLVGGLTALLSVYFFVQRRCSSVAGAIAALMFAQSGANHWFAEARPYAICFGLSGLSLVCWQRAAEVGPRKRWLAGLAICIALMVSFHYYSVLVVAPLMVGELVRFTRSRRVDWGILTALALGSAALLLWLPILNAVRSNVAGNATSAAYHGAPSIGHLYGVFSGIVGTLPIPILLLFAAVAASRSPGKQVDANRWLKPHELGMAIALALQPLIVFAVALLVTHTFTIRYSIASALGIGILFGEAAQRLTAGRARLATAVVLVLASHLYWLGLPLLTASRGNHYKAEFDFLGRAKPGVPVVVSGGHIYPVLHYYASQEWKKRLYYLVDLEAAQRYTDSSNERMMMSMKSIAPTQIVSRDSFVQAHPTFELYSSSEPGESLIEALSAHGCRLRLQHKEGRQLLFECTCPVR